MMAVTIKFIQMSNSCSHTISASRMGYIALHLSILFLLFRRFGHGLAGFLLPIIILHLIFN